MYGKVLVPLDGSKVAEQILPYARFLARTLKAPIEFIGVVDVAAVAPRVSSDNARYVDTLVSEGMRTCKDYLESIARTFPGISSKCIVVRGSPGEVIIERAADDKTTLVAMATHGRSGMNRWLLGSVAEKVLCGSSNPLLLVRATEQGKSKGESVLKSILVPLDGSELAEQVLPHVTSLAKTIPLEIVLFRAYSLKQLISTYEDYVPDWDVLEAESQGEASNYLNGKVRQLKSQGLVDVCSVISEGAAAEKIIDLAKSTANSLIAICTHGRSGVKRWVLGSVTERVVRHSGDPVLVIRAG